jgi:hypothetical protein
MRILTSVAYGLGGLAAVALFAGCGGSSNVPSAMQSNVTAHGAKHGSWMARATGTVNLLYVSNPGNNTVTAYSWQTGTLLGALDGLNLPHGLCVDAANDVYVTDWGSNQIFEYAHGDLDVIKTLSDPNRGPNACSIDPTTGNLAVTDDAGVSVYAGASGSPTLYTNSNFMSYFFPAYDASGNLFVDGTGMMQNGVFAELPKGGSTLGSMTLNKTILLPSGLQWDGKYLAVCEVGDSPNLIYAFSITGSTGTLKSTTTLTGSNNIEQFWIPNNGKIRGSTIVAANTNGDNVLYWKYPAGGAATKTITSGISTPFGVTLSK